jgi:hypothetical protein
VCMAEPGRGKFMNTATRKTTSRQAMRVATVFTGAAAAAVGFAPAALAAPGHAAAQDHPARANGKAQAMAPASSIRSAGCTTNTWLHIQYSSLLRDALCKQFGFAGKMRPVTPDGDTLAMNAQCGGNNIGNIYYSGKKLPYAQGTSYRSFNPFRVVSYVSIRKWSGTDECAWPR